MREAYVFQTYASPCARLLLLLALLITPMACGETGGSYLTPVPASQLDLEGKNYRIPKPILDNSGKYACPYTQDEILAEWVDMTVDVNMAENIGSMLGGILDALAQSQANGHGHYDRYGNYHPPRRYRRQNSPGAQDAFGALGRESALAASGGMSYVRETSDLSFDSLIEMSLWLYFTYSDNEHYESALTAMCTIYPDFKTIYRMTVNSVIKRTGRK